MKEYRLTGWPDLDASYERMAYRRMLCDMSQRYVTLTRLVTVSGLGKGEVGRFVALLESRGVVTQRDGLPLPSVLSTLRPLAWLRRALAPAHIGR
jgi:hypothetical protein